MKWPCSASPLATPSPTPPPHLHSGHPRPAEDPSSTPDALSWPVRLSHGSFCLEDPCPAPLPGETLPHHGRLKIHLSPEPLLDSQEESIISFLFPISI